MFNKSLCKHTVGFHHIIDVYLPNKVDWEDYDESRYLTVAEAVKVKCSYCGTIFLKRQQPVFRDKETGKFC